MKPDQELSWMRDGTERVLADVARLPDEALERPTALPGWTRRDLVAHLAANADALRNLVHWARTGEERRMYTSPEQRAADIAAGARRPAADLRSWLATASAAILADLDELPEGAWDNKIVTAQGLTRPARDIPWMRAREVYIHAIDLDAGTTWASLPPAFLTALLDDVAGRRSATGGGPALTVSATDSDRTWQVTGDGDPVPVSAALADVAAYLCGRPAPALPDAPVLPPWL